MSASHFSSVGAKKLCVGPNPLLPSLSLRFIYLDICAPIFFPSRIPKQLTIFVLHFILATAL